MVATSACQESTNLNKARQGKVRTGKDRAGQDRAGPGKVETGRAGQGTVGHCGARLEEGARLKQKRE